MKTQSCERNDIFQLQKSISCYEWLCSLNKTELVIFLKFVVFSFASYTTEVNSILFDLPNEERVQRAQNQYQIPIAFPKSTNPVAVTMLLAIGIINGKI